MSLSDFGVHLMVAFSECVVKAPVERKYIWRGERAGEGSVHCVCSFYGKRNCRSYAALLCSTLLYTVRTVWEPKECEVCGELWKQFINRKAWNTLQLDQINNSFSVVVVCLRCDGKSVITVWFELNLNFVQDSVD